MTAMGCDSEFRHTDPTGEDFILICQRPADHEGDHLGQWMGTPVPWNSYRLWTHTEIRDGLEALRSAGVVPTNIRGDVPT